MARPFFHLNIIISVLSVRQRQLARHLVYVPAWYLLPYIQQNKVTIKSPWLSILGTASSVPNPKYSSLSNGRRPSESAPSTQQYHGGLGGILQGPNMSHDMHVERLFQR